MSLVARLFPGADWTIEKNSCRLRVLHDGEMVEVQVLLQGPGHAPIAICIAVLKAASTAEVAVGV